VSTSSSPPGTILIADDNRVNRLLLSRGLEQQGHTVAFAENGREALDLLRRDRFELLLLDVLMPELDGYGVLAELKEDPHLRDIPVIMTSSLDELESVVKCVEMGAEDYLTKPINPVLLNARINASLEKKRLRDQQRGLISKIRDEGSSGGPVDVGLLARRQTGRRVRDVLRVGAENSIAIGFVSLGVGPEIRFRVNLVEVGLGAPLVDSFRAEGIESSRRGHCARWLRRRCAAAPDAALARIMPGNR
jgi:CheY-like chemotaxis protein